MKTQTHLKNTIDAIDSDKAKYDKNIKELLADIQVLSRILKYTVEEVKDLTIEEIIECIDDQSIEVGTALVDPGLTNTGRIENVQTENSVPNEGYISFDIRFSIHYKKKTIKIIINIEAQKSTAPVKLGYHLENRIIFYLSRLISSQKQREFFHSEYDKIKKVYSIWICMDASNDEDSVNKISLKEETLFGKPSAFSQLDKMCGIVIWIREQNDVEESKNQLIAMLEDLLKDEAIEKKKKNLEKKYNMKMTLDLERRIDDMCNLSDVVEERGIEKGIEKGTEKERTRVIQKMIGKGYTKEDILDMDYTEDEYKKAKDAVGVDV